jgi:type I restriction enzyme S subunit
MAIEFHRDGPWKLPEGWVWAQLGELGRWSGGGTPSKSNKAFWTDGTIPWISPKDMKADIVGDSEDRITEAAVANSSTKLVSASSVLMVVRSGILNHTFPVAVCDREVTLNQDMRALIPFDGIDARYVCLVLRRLQRHILEECSKDGTTVASVEPSRLEKVWIPIAPAAEQRRIVARIDDLFTEIADGETPLARALDDLDTWRRALLKAAVTGELTREWRKQSRPKESSDHLLARIKEGREVDFDPASKIFAGEDKFELSQLPETWVWARTQQICGYITKGTTPARSDFCSPEEGIPFIKVHHLTTTGELDFASRPSFVRKETHQGALARSIVRPGDVLMNIVGPPLGKVSIAPPSYPEWNCNQAIAIFRPQIVSPRFLALALSSESILRWAVKRSKASVGQINLTLEICRDLPIPLPPIDEQFTILERIREEILVLESAEIYIAASTLDTKKLYKSVLRAAFEGHLVEQDPRDESAVQLLTRVGELSDAPVQPRHAIRKRRAALAAE